MIEFLGDLPSRASLLTGLDYGTANSVLISHVQRILLNLVVIGTDGSTGVARIACSSVADQFLRTLTCNVLSIRGNSGVLRPLLTSISHEREVI